jgi:hypothetical protein
MNEKKTDTFAEKERKNGGTLHGEDRKASRSGNNRYPLVVHHSVNDLLHVPLLKRFS